MSNRLVIIGASGHGKVVAECAELVSRYDSIVFLDDRFPALLGVEHWQVLGGSADAVNYADNTTEFFVAIGNNQIREKVCLELAQCDLPLATLIHPKALVSTYSTIGEGSLICSGAVINPFCHVGKAVIINTSSSLDHDCVVDDYVHIAPGSRVAGEVKIGKGSFLGIASAVVQCLSIGEYSTLGAGSTLLSSIPANKTAVGTPARIIR